MKKNLALFAVFTALIFVISCGESSKTGDNSDTGETVTDGDSADSGQDDTASEQPDNEETDRKQGSFRKPFPSPGKRKPSRGVGGFSEFAYWKQDRMPASRKVIISGVSLLP